MTRLILIKPVPLTAEAFAPYGDVIEASAGAEQKIINHGNSIRYHDLARLDLVAGGGRPSVNIFRSTPLPRPVNIRVMERHPLSSQLFFPLSSRPYLVVVAAKGAFETGNIRAFLAGPGQGVNYHAGVWHHYSLALKEPADFLVIDRFGPGENCEEVSLNDGPQLCVDY